MLYNIFHICDKPISHRRFLTLRCGLWGFIKNLFVTVIYQKKRCNYKIKLITLSLHKKCVA